VPLRSIYHFVYDGSVVQAAAVDRTLNTGGRIFKPTYYQIIRETLIEVKKRFGLKIRKISRIPQQSAYTGISHIPLVLPYPCLIYHNVLIWQWVVWDLRLVLDREKTQRRFQGIL
jgi:hypothetical protein